jgi:hypothetical protein
VPLELQGWWLAGLRVGAMVAWDWDWVQRWEGRAAGLAGSVAEAASPWDFALGLRRAFQFVGRVHLRCPSLSRDPI